MARKIEFRAWDGQHNEMVNHSKMLHDPDDWFMSLLLNEDPDCSLMQFTGLTDKNGKDIYEGDLLKNKFGRMGQVIWHQPSASFDTKFVRNLHYNSISVGFENSKWGYHLEVIGNIHENPELLKGG